eukprot:1405054-Amphidinium_carterae.3
MSLLWLTILCVTHITDKRVCELLDTTFSLQASAWTSLVSEKGGCAAAFTVVHVETVLVRAKLVPTRACWSCNFCSLCFGAVLESSLVAEREQAVHSVQLQFALSQSLAVSVSRKEQPGNRETPASHTTNSIHKNNKKQNKQGSKYTSFMLPGVLVPGFFPSLFEFSCT